MFKLVKKDEKSIPNVYKNKLQTISKILQLGPILFTYEDAEQSYRKLENNLFDTS